MQYGPYNQQPPQPPYGQPPPPQAPPPGWGQPQAAPPAPEKPKKAGCLMPVLWLVVTFLVTLVCAAFVGLMAADSESKGVEATQVVALPFGFVWGGLLAASIIQIAWKKASTAVRVAGPLGCGCLGGIIMILLVIVFFSAIFPAL
jgi:hypothetical protein